MKYKCSKYLETFFNFSEITFKYIWRIFKKQFWKISQKRFLNIFEKFLKFYKYNFSESVQNFFLNFLIFLKKFIEFLKNNFWKAFQNSYKKFSKNFEIKLSEKIWGTFEFFAKIFDFFFFLEIYREEEF